MLDMRLQVVQQVLVVPEGEEGHVAASGQLDGVLVRTSDSGRNNVNQHKIMDEHKRTTYSLVSFPSISGSDRKA
jgi:hypothetical protein